MEKYRKSIFTPINHEKYIGRTPIIARSSWEKKFMRFLDSTSAVIKWSSESIAIGYVNPITNKPNRYYPDFLITLIDKNGVERTELIEVKPFKQTQMPKQSSKKSKKTMYIEAKNWVINQAKWTAALQYCKDRNINFRIMTEKDLF